MIHRALRLLRAYHGLKQKDLAKLLGISSSHLSEIETGVKGVTYDLLENYAKVLKVPVSTITMFADATGSKDKKSVVSKVSDGTLRLLEWLETISRVTPQVLPKNLTLDQCALYKVRSPKHLAEILLTDLGILKSLADGGRANYHVFQGPLGDRWIEGPGKLLKKVQRRIQQLLAQIAPPRFLHSGVKGRCAVSNALRHLECHGTPVPSWT